ncbi:MAG: hypothetical protein M0Q91_13135 [Methanoregula sp.]|jgi:phage-related tail fiber protein|nr:hypothetical protein [Methanoregula sp.]
MMQINGRITTVHRNAQCVASALAPDNLTSMTTTAEGDHVTTELTGTQLRSVIASMDDYLMNLAIAEDACSSFSHRPADLNSTKHPSNTGHTARKKGKCKK